MDENDDSNVSCTYNGEHSKVSLCTSDSYDFMNIPFDEDRGEGFVDATVAVIDGCRRMEPRCNRAELTFLTDFSGLVAYEALGTLCESCAEHKNELPNVGINPHGFFCGAIAISRKIPSAKIGELYLGALRGISPPPRLALYAIGCPSCLGMDSEDIVEGIRAAILQKVDVISMSLSQNVYNRSEVGSNVAAQATLDAFKEGIITVIPAGNLGKHLRYITKAPPWCVTVGSCTSRRIYMTEIEFESPCDRIFDAVQGYSTNIFSTDVWIELRARGEIQNSKCIIFLDDDTSQFVIQRCSDHDDAPSATPNVYISKEQSNKIHEWLDFVAKEEEYLCVKIHASTKVEVPNSPLVSEFSSRGPCQDYEESMKPDLCAPGEQIAAAWPPDVPLGGLGRLYLAEYNVLSGTSHAVPHVAAGLAMLCATLKLSPSATISASITTATKMHGKDPIAREYAYGAGMFNLNKAMRPGLVYEEDPRNHERYFYGKLAHLNLNLPYFSARFPIGDKPWDCKFERKLRSVEFGKTAYYATVQTPHSSLDFSSAIQIIANPKRLVFDDYGSEQEFSLSVQLPHTKVSNDSFGLISAALIWRNEDNDDIIVDCPIILSSRVVPPIHIVEDLYKGLQDMVV